MRLTAKNLEDLARGAAFLGTGGGGDPYIGRLVAQRAIDEHGAPEVVDLSQLADDAAVYTVAMIGAPTVLIEKLVGGPEIELAVAELEKYLRRPADAILPVEMGGCNSMLPIKVAATRRLPLIDADGMGRAFPELPMVTFNVHGIPACPLALANEHGEFHILGGARSAKAAEAMARQMVVHMGGGAGISCYPLDGAQAKRAAIPGTLTLALEIGRAIRRGRRRGDPFAALLGYLRTTDYYRHAKTLFDGKIVDIVRETTRGFAVGRLRIRGFGDHRGDLEVVFQNENLVARLDGRTRAIVPDLICVLDRETAEPITTEGIRYGQRVRVIAASVPPIMRSAEALQVFGPRAFGIDEDFQPIEALE